MKTLKAAKKYPFERGYGKVEGDNQPKVKAELMKGLSITTRQGWSKRLKGEVEPTVSEAQFIERVFRKHGITEVWGLSRKGKQKTKTATKKQV